VNAYERAPAVVAGRYLRDRSRTEATFGFGSKLQDAFLAAVTLAPTPEGAVGRFEVLAWQESGAEIHGRDEMSRLRGRVAEAIREVGGTVNEDGPEGRNAPTERHPQLMATRPRTRPRWALATAVSLIVFAIAWLYTYYVTGQWFDLGESFMFLAELSY
jgi:hypothetical protein